MAWNLLLLHLRIFIFIGMVHQLELFVRFVYLFLGRVAGQPEDKASLLRVRWCCSELSVLPVLRVGVSRVFGC